MIHIYPRRSVNKFLRGQTSAMNSRRMILPKWLGQQDFGPTFRASDMSGRPGRIAIFVPGRLGGVPRRSGQIVGCAAPESRYRLSRSPCRSRREVFAPRPGAPRGRSHGRRWVPPGKVRQPTLKMPFRRWGSGPARAAQAKSIRVKRSSNFMPMERPSQSDPKTAARSFALFGDSFTP